MRTLADEWADQARTLADHPTSTAARRHAAHQARNIPLLRDRESSSMSDKALGRCIETLMKNFWCMGEDERAMNAAKALRCLADALQSPDTFAERTLTKKTPATAPEEIPYRPGVDK